MQRRIAAQVRKCSLIFPSVTHVGVAPWFAPPVAQADIGYVAPGSELRTEPFVITKPPNGQHIRRRPPSERHLRAAKRLNIEDRRLANFELHDAKKSHPASVMVAELRREGNFRAGFTVPFTRRSSSRSRSK